MRLLFGLLAISAFVADPAPKPIPKVYIVAVSGLGQRVQAVTKEAQDSVAEFEVDLCKSIKLERDACFVDWQKGFVGPKPKDAPKPAETPKP